MVYAVFKQEGVARIETQINGALRVDAAFRYGQGCWQFVRAGRKERKARLGLVKVG